MTTQLTNASGVTTLPSSGQLLSHAFRFIPDTDLVPALEWMAGQAMASTSGSAFVQTAVGSLKSVTLRLASAQKHSSNGEYVNDLLTLQECVEVTSLVGTFCPDGKHLHITVAKADGTCIGGHLVEGIVFTTMEIVMGTISGVVFERQIDESTGYRELVVHPSHHS